MAVEAKHKSSSFLSYIWKHKTKLNKNLNNLSCVFPASVLTFSLCLHFTSCPDEAQKSCLFSLYLLTGKRNRVLAGSSKVFRLEDMGSENLDEAFEVWQWFLGMSIAALLGMGRYNSAFYCICHVAMFLSFSLTLASDCLMLTEKTQIDILLLDGFKSFPHLVYQYRVNVTQSNAKLLHLFSV